MASEVELACSPRKIRKIASIRSDIQQKLSQGSQESRATSTPTRRNRMLNLSIPSDISSIVQEAPQTPAISTSSTSNEKGSDDVSRILSAIEELSLSQRSSICSVGSEILHRPKVFRGKTWGYFKPKNEDSLYGKVLGNFDNIGDTAFDFLDNLRSNERQGTLSLIKFFIDLCGYQSVTIDGLFDFDKNFPVSCEKVIKMLEFDYVNDEMLEANTYIFLEADKHTKLGDTLAAAIQSFLEQVFIGAYAQNVLFSKPFEKYIFQFLFYMCQGILRCIRHTGVTLVRTILKIHNHIYLRTLKKKEVQDSESRPNCLPIEKEIEYAERYIQSFFNIFIKNSFISDPKLFSLKAENIKEMGNWIEELPQVYVANCMSSLVKLQFDESELVRLKTVQVWKKLIKSKNVHSHVVKYLGDVVRLVQGRLSDVQLKVVVESVEFFTLLLDHHPQIINEDMISTIMELLYANSYLYAKAAGFFTIKLFNSRQLNETDLLKNLVNMSSIPRFQKMKFFFVESFMEVHTVIDNYKLIMDVLLSCNKGDSNDMTYALDVIELMYYSVYQKLMGHPLVQRKDSLTGSPSSFGHEEVAKVVFVNLKNFMDLFRDQVAILKYLLKILLLVDYESLSSSYRPYLIFLTKNCRRIFLEEPDEELLEKICKLFYYLCYEKNTSIQSDLKKFLVNLFETLSSYLQGYLESEEQEVDQELHFLKIGKLYEIFNLNKYFNWNGIFEVWGTRPLWRGQMISCHYYIVWIVKELVEEEKDDQYRKKKIELSVYFAKYTLSLVELMTSSDAEVKLKLDAFETFCWLHLHAHEATKNDLELADFRLQILQSLNAHIPEKLVTFFEKTVVNNKIASFESRKNLICHWLNLILNGLTDVFYLVPVFECYQTKSEEYGSLIEYVAAKIFAHKQEVFFQLILATLIQSVSRIFYTLCRSFSSPEARDLENLASKFSCMKEFSNSSAQVLKMLDTGFKHCFQNSLLELLVILQHFLQKLSEEHFKECLEIFKENTPKELENKKYVKIVRGKLEAGKSKLIGENRRINSSNFSGSHSDKSESKPAPLPIKRVNNRKSLRVEETSKENIENVSPKKKVKTPKSRKTKK